MPLLISLLFLATEKPMGFVEAGFLDIDVFITLVKMSLGWLKNIFIGTWAGNSARDSVQAHSLEHTNPTWGQTNIRSSETN